VGELECDVRLIDAAGQDLRLLFGDEQILSVESLPGRLQALAEYCRAADIILFLINLKDFLGQGDPEQRTANEAAIKSAMDYLGGDGRARRVCLVLAQTDLYRDLARVRGGWLELVAEAVPYVFGAHLRVRQVAVHPVSAVADTQVVVDRDGNPRRVPTAGFRSEGLDELVAWLTTQLRDVKQELDQEAKATAPAQQTSVPPAVEPPLPPLRKPAANWGNVIGTVLAIIIGIPVMRACIPGCSVTTPAQPTRPTVTDVWGFKWGMLNDDIWVENTSGFTITNVELTVKIVKNGQAWQPFTLKSPGIYPQQTYTWTDAVSVPGSTVDQATTAQLTCDQNR
jgi:NAD(P)H-dependent FMN reductase